MFYKVVDGVSIDKSSLLGVVSVEVEVKGESIVFDQMRGEFLDGKDCWLLLEGGVEVVTIQVFAKTVHAEMTVVNSIDVDHGDYHEDEHLF